MRQPLQAFLHQVITQICADILISTNNLEWHLKRCENIVVHGFNVLNTQSYGLFVAVYQYNIYQYILQ